MDDINEQDEILNLVFKEEEAITDLVIKLFEDVNPNYTDDEIDDFIDFVGNWEDYDDNIRDIYQIYKYIRRVN